MWIDTHCHLDLIFAQHTHSVILDAASHNHVVGMIVPATHPDTFSATIQAGRLTAMGGYTLGIHPLWASSTQPHHLQQLQEAVDRALPDPFFLGIGEIGLDFFVTEPTSFIARQQHLVFEAQLDLAAQYHLPVIIHSRKAHDVILKALRYYAITSGIIHAFNGSKQQAYHFLKQGFKLGFGGAMTYDRALQIRRLVQTLPISALVLETDAPDMPPAWLPRDAINEPAHIPRIAACMAAIRQCSLDTVQAAVWHNLSEALPRWHVKNLLK
jgi:TatD DNase family protein